MDLADPRLAVSLIAAPSLGDLTTLEALARRSLATCHAELMAARDAVLASRDVEGIHRTRVALRRIRAVAVLFGRALGEQQFVSLRADAKQFATACGPTRDLDVFLAGVLKQAQEQLAARPDIGEALRAFGASAQRQRRSRHDAARRALSSDIFAIFEARLAKLATEPVGGGPTELCGAAEFARDLLSRRDRKLRRKLKRLDDLDGKERHALRLQVKRHRYTASFLSPLFGRKATGYIQAAAGLQDALGLANDRVVAVEVVAEIRGAVQPRGRLDWCAGVLTGWLVTHAGATEDERAIATAARRFVRAPRFWRGGTVPVTQPEWASGEQQR